MLTLPSVWNAVYSLTVSIDPNTCRCIPFHAGVSITFLFHYQQLVAKILYLRSAETKRKSLKTEQIIDFQKPPKYTDCDN